MRCDMSVLTEQGMDTLKKQLILYEGVKCKPYYCTADKLTIGVGRNLEDRGINEDEVMYLLNNDIALAESELIDRIKDFSELSEMRKVVLINMSFNLGVTKLMEFNKMLSAIGNRDYKQAAEEMLDSKWARQVGQRAVELSELMLKG